MIRKPPAPPRPRQNVGRATSTSLASLCRGRSTEQRPRKSTRKSWKRSASQRHGGGKVSSHSTAPWARGPPVDAIAPRRQEAVAAVGSAWAERASADPARMAGATASRAAKQNRAVACGHERVRCIWAPQFPPLCEQSQRQKEMMMFTMVRTYDLMRTDKGKTLRSNNAIY